jgi:cytochrome c peroxidase
MFSRFQLRKIVRMPFVRGMSSNAAWSSSRHVFRSHAAAILFGTAIAGVTVFIAQPSLSYCASVDYAKVKADIIAAIAADEEKRGDGTSMGPTLVRLAWHASGTYSIFDKTGGSSTAAMRFSPESDWGANAGLKIARDFLEPFKRKYGLSYGDLWTLAGVAAIEGMGGPKIAWRPGRKDVDAKSVQALPDGRLPNANMGCPVATNSHIRDIFGRMGFNDREIVALLGAHAVGRCHTEASGFWGPWNFSETTFSNEYFRLLLEEKWTVKKTHNGQPWKGPMQYEDKTGKLMMLPSDLWLLEDKAFKPLVQAYAKDEQLFFNDFAAAFGKLLEMGVKF